MSRAAAGVVLLPGEPSPNETLRLLAGDAAERRAPNNLWYRFIVTDGTDTDYYADDTPALDGGLGAPSDDAVDQQLRADRLTSPASRRPAWAAERGHLPDLPRPLPQRRAKQRPAHRRRRATTTRSLALPWGTLPEGYCRNYADARRTARGASTRTPPTEPDQRARAAATTWAATSRASTSSSTTSPRSASTRSTSTRSSTPARTTATTRRTTRRIDPYFGTQKDWENLVKHADEARHPDRSSTACSTTCRRTARSSTATTTTPTVGACESRRSPYRDWFVFTDRRHVPVRRPGPTTRAGSASTRIPVLNKAQPGRPGVLPAPTPTHRAALAATAARPAGGWTCRATRPSRTATGRRSARSCKATDPDALTISETWQKDSTLLRMIRGDRLDTTMNYRLRDAVLGLLAPQGFDSRASPTAAASIAPSEFAARLASIREDYPDAAYYSLMNLLDSHDTERLLWTLTPGAETPAAQGAGTRPTWRPASSACGSPRSSSSRVPGAPTVYYGDEVGRDRRRRSRRPAHLPVGRPGRHARHALSPHYTGAGRAPRGPRRVDRRRLPRAARRRRRRARSPTAAKSRRRPRSSPSTAATRRATLTIPVAGFVPTARRFTRLRRRPAGGRRWPSAGGIVDRHAAGAARRALLLTGPIDLAPPAAPTACTSPARAASEVSLAWNAVAGAAGYNVYRSPVTRRRLRQGERRAGHRARRSRTPGSTNAPHATTTSCARSTRPATRAALERGRRRCRTSSIGWANLQWPPTMTHTISADRPHGRRLRPGLDRRRRPSQPGPTPEPARAARLRAGRQRPGRQRGLDVGRGRVQRRCRQQRRVRRQPAARGDGTFDYAYRYTTTDGRDWVYADLDGIGNGYGSAQAGALDRRAERRHDRAGGARLGCA